MDLLNFNEIRSFCTSALKVYAVELVLTAMLYLFVLAVFKARKIVVKNRARSVAETHAKT